MSCCLDMMTVLLNLVPYCLELINSSDSLIEVPLMYKCATEINGVSMVLMLDITSGVSRADKETYVRKIIYCLERDIGNILEKLQENNLIILTWRIWLRE